MLLGPGLSGPQDAAPPLSLEGLAGQLHLWTHWALRCSSTSRLSGSHFCALCPSSMFTILSVTIYVYVVYEDTNLYNDMGMT